MSRSFRSTFIHHIQHKNMLLVRFFALKTNSYSVRVLYPLDYGVGRNIHKDSTPRYHFWEPIKHHPLLLRRWQIDYIEPLGLQFDYSEFITWTPEWQIPRDGKRT